MYQLKPSSRNAVAAFPSKNKPFLFSAENIRKCLMRLYYYNINIISNIYWGTFYTFSGYFFPPVSILCDRANEDKQKQPDDQRHRAVYPTTKSAKPALVYFLFNSPTPTQLFIPCHRLNSTYNIDRQEDSLYPYISYIGHNNLHL